MRTNLILCVLLTACSSGGSPEPAAGATTGAEAEAAAEPATPTEDATALACVGEYHRSALGISCRNAGGGWTTVDCMGCNPQSDGSCARPHTESGVPGCHPGEPCPGPQVIEAGGCLPACCDPSLPGDPAAVL